MAGHAVRGISAPPEVVFSTATDPDRQASWLPAAWRTDPAGTGGDDFAVRLLPPDEGGWSGVLQVRAGDAGGSSVELRVDGSGDGTGPGEPAQILDRLEREVVDNFNAG